MSLSVLLLILLTIFLLLHLLDQSLQLLPLQSPQQLVIFVLLGFEHLLRLLPAEEMVISAESLEFRKGLTSDWEKA